MTEPINQSSNTISMKVLLDTHTFIWLDTAPEKLSAVAMRACQNPDNELYLSVASVWEILIKSRLGKLTLDVPLESMIQVQRELNNLQILPIGLDHVLTLQNLPSHHNDPFDRILIVQALVEGAQMVSADEQLKQYQLEVVW